MTVDQVLPKREPRGAAVDPEVDDPERTRQIDRGVAHVSRRLLSRPERPSAGDVVEPADVAGADRRITASPRRVLAAAYRRAGRARRARIVAGLLAVAAVPITAGVWSAPAWLPASDIVDLWLWLAATLLLVLANRVEQAPTGPPRHAQE